MQRALLTIAFGVASSSLGVNGALLAAGGVTLAMTLPLLPIALRAESDVTTV